MKKQIALTIVLVLAFAALSANAQTTTFTYQGRLTDGSLPASGTYEMQFRLFDADAGGAQIGSTLEFTVLNGSPVTVTNGVFTVPLNFAAAAFPGADRFLSISVRPNSGASYTPLNPRQPVTSAPYSVKSLRADNATNAVNATTATNATTAATSTNATQLNGQSGSFYQSASNLSSGTLAALRLPIPLTLSGTSGTHIIRGENSNSSGTGVVGSATSTTGTNYGVYGHSASSGGRAVFADATATTGTTFGVYGRSAGSIGRGVLGEATSSLFGSSSIGVLGRSLSNNLGGIGVFGEVPSTTGPTTGVYGQSASSSGTGVQGSATSTTGTNYGVYGSTLSPTGYAGYFTGPAGSQNYFERSLGIGTAAPTASLSVFSTLNTTGDNTATFKNTTIGPFESHIHYGSAGDWFVRSAASSGRVILQDTGGNVGIGTSTPNAKLQVTGGNIYVPNPNSLIITSPNGACWFITVGNTGALSTLSVTCP